LPKILRLGRFGLLCALNPGQKLLILRVTFQRLLVRLHREIILPESEEDVPGGYGAVNCSGDIPGRG
jgi:hypothetical protein